MSRAGAARDTRSAELFSRPAAAIAPATVVVAEGEDVSAACTRRGPRRMFVEVVLQPGPWVSTTCLVCRVIDTSHGIDLESVRARVERQHAGCAARLGAQKTQRPDESKSSSRGENPGSS